MSTEQEINEACPGMPAAKSICVVEDDKLLALIYSRYLAKEGFVVEVCPSGAEAWRTMNQKQFDLLLLDLVLPDMNGMDLLKQLRAESRFEKIPCVIITNTPLIEVLRSAHSVGVEHVFPKSQVKAPQIVAAIKEILSVIIPSSSTADSQAEVGKTKDVSWML
jgi:CheY-like chemotaxis protein